MARAPSDRELGIRAQRSVAKERLGLEGANRQHAERYEASPPHILEEMLLGLPIDEPRTTFIDLGCGKGRVLCHAALRPFHRVVGVELSAALCRQARANIEAMPHKLKRAKAIEVQHKDAAALRFGPGPLVVYMYNPFGPAVLRPLLGRLSQRPPGAPAWLLYYEPKHQATVDALPAFRIVQAQRDWIIYQVDTPSTQPSGPQDETTTAPPSTDS